MKDGYYFISDAHLGLQSKDEERLKEFVLLKFLDEIKKDAKELFIVGDLFDFWIEYRSVVPKGHYKLLTKISELVENNIKITYLAGNHDFWRGNYFKNEFGIDIQHTYIIREINNKKFFIHHGDGLAYKDFGYKVLKKILRNRVSQFLYSLLHPDIGIWLAKTSSASSREYTSTKDYSKSDGLKNFAIQKIHEGYDYVLMGHRHFPHRYKDEKGLYINLGDWYRNFSYTVYKDGELKCMRFYDIKTKQFLKISERELNLQN
jgi:UDP-2,3-diacylglucosamine hydrolase